MLEGYPWSAMTRSKNYAAAIELATELANQGDPAAQRMLGWMYHHGHGTEHNLTEALKWYSLAALQGDLNSMSYLGDIYSKKESKAFDKEEALRWHTEAAKRGDLNAQFSLGYLLLDTEEPKRDWHQAEKRLFNAAVQGHVNSQWALGMLHAVEISGKLDYVKSYAWLELARLNKDKGAIEAQNEVKKWMTKDQIQQAEDYARHLFVNHF